MKLFEKLSKKLDFEHILHFGTWGILMGTYIAHNLHAVIVLKLYFKSL